jgi:hypothetical protein
MTIKTRADFPKLLEFYSLPKIICECGCAEGIFATEIFGWNVEKLYLVDIWEHFPLIEGCASFEPEWHEKNYKEVSEKFKDAKNVVLLKGLSYKMAKNIPDESLGLLYIDGDHTYEGVMTDYHAYLPKVIKGGIIGFHDAKNPNYGVERAIFDITKGVGINDLVEDGDIGNMGAYIIRK